MYWNCNEFDITWYNYASGWSFLYGGARSDKPYGNLFPSSIHNWPNKSINNDSISTDEPWCPSKCVTLYPHSPSSSSHHFHSAGSNPGATSRERDAAKHQTWLHSCSVCSCMIPANMQASSPTTYLTGPLTIHDDGPLQKWLGTGVTLMTGGPWSCRSPGPGSQ